MSSIALMHYDDCLNDLLKGLPDRRQCKLPAKVDLVIEQRKGVLPDYSYFLFIFAAAIAVENQRMVDFSQKMYTIFDT